MDKGLVGYALLASPPASYTETIKEVTLAIEELGGTLVFQKTRGAKCRRGDFKSITFGCSYGGGQKVTGPVVSLIFISLITLGTI